MIPIHVINLKHRLDRREHIVEQLEKNGLNYEIVEAVHGTDVDVDNMHSQGLIDFKYRRLTKGEYGCYLSHLNIYKSILVSDEETHLILEDDVYFVINFKGKYQKVLSHLEALEWDICYLGINYANENSRDGVVVGPGMFIPDHPSWGTQAYLIKKSTLTKIMPKLTPITIPIDVHLMSLDMRRICLHKNIVKIKYFDSETNPLAWKE